MGCRGIVDFQAFLGEKDGLVSADFQVTLDTAAIRAIQELVEKAEPLVILDGLDTRAIRGILAIRGIPVRMETEPGEEFS